MSFFISKSYSFPEIVLTIGGYRIGGFADDGGVSIEYAGDDVSMAVGADGEVTVNQMAQQPAVATITLKETSSSNAVLQVLRVAQRNAAAGYVLPFLLLDPNTGESLASPEAAFMGPPASISKTREASERVWKIGLPYPTYVPATV